MRVTRHRARSDLCGRRSAMSVPTAIQHATRETGYRTGLSRYVYECLNANPIDQQNT